MGSTISTRWCPVPLLVHIYCQLQSLSIAAPQALDPCVPTSKVYFFLLCPSVYTRISLFFSFSSKGKDNKINARVPTKLQVPC